MNLLDEQMRQDQRHLLARWGIPFRQIPFDGIQFYVRGEARAKSLAWGE